MSRIPIINYRQVHAAFDGRRLFAGITLDLYENEIFVLFGPANCGKSLFGRLALRLVMPDSGRIYLEGRDISIFKSYEIPVIRRKIGAVFINSALISNLTAAENVALPLRYHTSLSEKEIGIRVDTVLDFFNALHCRDLRPVGLDVVARRKVAVARALILRPRIVFLDEPTVHLGFIASNLLQHAIFNFINSEFWFDEGIFAATNSKKTGTTIFISTNDPGRYLHFGNRFGMLYNGKLVFVGSTEELMDTQNQFVHQFVSGNADGPVHEY